MPVLLIGDHERALIEAAIKRAKANPISWETLKAGSVKQPAFKITLADRKPGVERPSSEHVWLGDYRAAISFEEQPSGLCRHLSLSSRRPGTLPSFPVFDMIVEAYGWATRSAALQGANDAISAGTVWLEEFDPGHYAINVLEIEPR